MADTVLFNNNQNPPPAPNPNAQSAGNPAQGTEIPLNQLPHDLKGQGPVVKPQTPPPPPSGFPGGLFLKIGGGIIGVVILLFLIFAVIVPLFTHGGANTKDVTLTYWGLWENENTMDVLIKDFEKDHPHIKIKYIKQDPQKYPDKLVAQIGTPTGPDIFRYHSSWVPMLRSKLLPLPESVIKAKTFSDTYYPVISDDVASYGPIYGIPLDIDTLSLFINREITRDFDVPTNWVDFANVATSVTVVGGDGKIETAGAALGTMDNITHAPDIISMLMVQNGADLYADDLSASQNSMSSALDFYTSFANGDSKVWDSSMENSLDAFAHEKLAMYFGYSWDIYQIRQLNPKLQFEVHPVPGLPGDRNMTVASYWVEGVSAKTTHQQEALAFMQYLTKKDTLEKFYSTIAKSREFGELYPMPSLKSRLKDNKLIYPFVSQADKAQSTYFVSDTHDENGINGQMNNYLSDAINAILNENKSSQTAIETLTSGITAVRQQYGF